MNRAVELLAAKALGGRGRTSAAAIKDLGEHPQQGGPIQVMAGRYGPYVKWDKLNATLPKDIEPETLTLEMAVALIAEKAAKGGKGSKTTKAKAKGAAKPKAASKAKAKPKTPPKPKPAPKTR
jgi:DNA topoisomerase-1